MSEGAASAVMWACIAVIFCSFAACTAYVDGQRAGRSADVECVKAGGDWVAGDCRAKGARQ